MKSLVLFVLVLAGSAAASFKECPRLRGHYFCEGVAGSHKDMNMIITEAFASGRATYYYLYEQKGEPAEELRFLASDQGERNPDLDGMIGRCAKGYYFNSADGRPNAKTLLNYVNRQGDYEVIYYKDGSLFLRCRRTR
ncbi:MAG: hypothetical protein JST04_02320 [Bdellovibrionales bacterium]|nr:hypothetical protein [Bdellovibrionales bacterium]